MSEPRCQGHINWSVRTGTFIGLKLLSSSWKSNEAHCRRVIGYFPDISLSGHHHQISLISSLQLLWGCHQDFCYAMTFLWEAARNVIHLCNWEASVHDNKNSNLSDGTVICLWRIRSMPLHSLCEDEYWKYWPEYNAQMNSFHSTQFIPPSNQQGTYCEL